MKMTDLILRLVSNWYDPAEQERREERTAKATDQATTVRGKAIVSAQRVTAVRQSYEQSERRLRPRPPTIRG